LETTRAEDNQNQWGETRFGNTIGDEECGRRLRSVFRK
jgi:hypothetical protein